MDIKAKNTDLAAVILIALTIFTAYINTLPNGFIFDDRHTILGNSYIKHWETLPRLFGDKTTSVPIAQGMWRPLLMLSFAFNYFFSGLNPQGYHLINILLHFLNAVLFYLFLRLFLNKARPGLLLALSAAFCLHPLNTEAVTYISSRSVILCSLFILLGLYNYIRWRAGSLRRHYLFSLASYILALMSKEIAMVLPLLILAYELTFGENRKEGIKKPALGLLPFIAITITYLIMIKLVIGGTLGSFVKAGTAMPRPLFSNILTQGAVSFYYIYLFFFPLNLCLDHNFPIITGIGNPLGLIPLLLILILIAYSLLLRKGLPIISLSILWYFICLLPQFYARLNVVSAEHHSYLANLGLYFLLGYLLSKWKGTDRALRLAFIFILGLFFLLTLIRNLQWRNEYTLWKADLKTNPKSEIALGSLGLYLINSGFGEEGERYLNQALNSKSEIIFRPTVLNLAAYYASFKNQPEKGKALLDKHKDYFLKKDPLGYLKTIGIVYLKMGKTREAREAWEKAAHISPESPEIKSNLGWWHIRYSREMKKAKDYFEDTIKLNPDFAPAHLGLGMLLEKEYPKKAAWEYQKTISLSPQNPNPYYRIGILYLWKLSDSRAGWYFKKTLELIPDFAPAHYNLGLFYLFLVRPDYQKAKEHFDKAKELGARVNPKIEEMIQRGINPED